MNAQKYTQKSLEAIQAAQSLAVENSNQQIEQQHLALALADNAEGLIPQLLKKIGIEPGGFVSALEASVSKLPKVSGVRESGKIYVNADVDRVLNDSEKLAASMKDDFVSVEHVFMAILDSPNSEMKRIFGDVGLKKDDFLKALAAVRGSKRVTSDDPEKTYDALKKYGTDLVERARLQKQIGRAHV